MTKRRLLAITTVLIVAMAVIGTSTTVSANKLFVSGGDKKLYCIDPSSMTVIASKYVGQSSTWPSNQYSGDKRIWLPGGGSAGLIVIKTNNNCRMNVQCMTGLPSNWVEISPTDPFGPNSFAMVTHLASDTVSKLHADIGALGCPDPSNPLDKTVYDTTKHDGPCDMTISPDNTPWSNWACVPDIFSGMTNGNGYDSVTLINTSNLNDQVIYYMPRCNNNTPIVSFMTTIDPHGNNPYCFVENFESLISPNSGSESVIDMSDPQNPKEIVRFVQDSVLADFANKCPNGFTSGSQYFLPRLDGSGDIEIKGGFGLIPRSDEFTKSLSGGRKFNFIMLKGSQEVAVVDVDNLDIINRITLPSGCKTDTGDFSNNGQKFFVNCDKGNMVCRIDVNTADTSTAPDVCVNIGTRARGIVWK